MANVDSPFGMKPVRYKSGAPYNGAVNPMWIDGDYGTALFVGDPVIKVAGGSNDTAVSVPGAGLFNIGTLPSVEKATAGDANKITGVIVGFSALPSDLTKQYNPASTERVAWVADDPNLVFEIQADGAIPAANMGFNADLVYTHSGSTYTGLSGAELNSATDEADQSSQLLIVGAVNRDDNDTTLTHCKVLVMINQHTESQGSAGALGI